MADAQQRHAQSPLVHGLHDFVCFIKATVRPLWVDSDHVTDISLVLQLETLVIDLLLQATSMNSMQTMLGRSVSPTGT